MKTLDEARKVTADELKKLTEPEVDDYFAAAGDEYYRLGMKLRRARDHARTTVGDKKRHHGDWTMTLTEAEELIASATDEDTVKARARIGEIENQIWDLDKTVWAKLEAEFERRGGWTRAYLVTDGHVHRTRQCSSCNKGEYPTEFSWMIDYSGKTEAEIIEAADERACTICYPSAPVAKKVGKPDLSKSKMFTPEEKDRAAAREQAAVKKAKAAADRAAKAIADVDGTPLTVHTWTQKAHQKQVGGRLVDVPEREFSDTITTLHAARGWLTDQFDERRGTIGHRDTDKVARAIAAKEGKDSATVIAEAKERARKRRY